MVKIENLTFSYDEKEIISDFCCEIKSGERVCIAGSSGKGKTTLLRLILGLEKPQKGSVCLDKNAKTAVVFQDDVLLPWYTAKENVSCVSDENTSEKWLDLFGLADAADKFPSQLSGGMKRRVALARACAFSPDILILDEAFKGLDEALKSDIIAALIREFENKTIIFTSHEKDEITAFATRIICV